MQRIGVTKCGACGRATVPKWQDRICGKGNRI